MFELVLSEYMRTMLRGDLKRCLSNSHLTRRSKNPRLEKRRCGFFWRGTGKRVPEENERSGLKDSHALCSRRCA